MTHRPRAPKALAAYLMALGVLACAGLVVAATGALPTPLAAFPLVVQCALVGALGGVVYCLRGLYLSRSVRNDWSDDWITWYVLRPWVSLACGGVTFVFLRAGLLVLEGNQTGDPSAYGFLALAFIAGLNVDGLVRRLEGIAESSWGIEPSRASRVQGPPPPPTRPDSPEV